MGGPSVISVFLYMIQSNFLYYRVLYEMWQKSNEIFYSSKFLFFSNISFMPFKIVLLDSYTQMEALFPLLVAAL